MTDTRHQLKLGVYGAKAFGLAQGLMRAGALPIGGGKFDGCVAPAELRLADDGEVTLSLSELHYVGESVKRLRVRFADRLLQATRHCLAERLAPEDIALASLPTPSLRKSACAAMRIGDFGTLGECLCLVEAIRGADKASLVKAYGEAVANGVCGAQADWVTVAAIVAIRRRMDEAEGKYDAERLAIWRRYNARVKEMEAEYIARAAEAEAEIRRMRGGQPE